MPKRIFLILIGGFIVQFLFSCGKCGPSPSFEMVHTELNLSTGAELDNQFKLNEDTIRKENFRLEIYFDHEQASVSELNPSYSFGFSNAKALDCPPPYYNYSDKVADLSIIMINQADSSQTLDVTNYFGNSVGAETRNIKDLVGMQYENKSHLSLYLSFLDFEELYHHASFSVTATLESGIIFTQETEKVIFTD